MSVTEILGEIEYSSFLAEFLIKSDSYYKRTLYSLHNLRRERGGGVIQIFAFHIIRNHGSWIIKFLDSEYDPLNFNQNESKMEND